MITPAFRLPAPVRHIVHAVGPRFGVDEPAAESHVERCILVAFDTKTHTFWGRALGGAR